MYRNTEEFLGWAQAQLEQQHQQAQQQAALQQQQSSLGFPWAHVQNNTAATNNAWSQPVLPFALLDIANLRDRILSMTWQCTNPSCRKPLELAKRGKDKYQPKGVLILECKYCGFEFAVQADVEKVSSKRHASKTDFEIAALRKKVKDFELS